MANVRCYRLLGRRRNGRVRVFSHFAEPIGHLNTSVICGRRDCDRPGYVWLTEEEVQNIQAALRVNPRSHIIVQLFNNGAHIKVEINPRTIQVATGFATTAATNCPPAHPPRYPLPRRSVVIIPYS